jgi:hypothetical protein
LCNLSYLAARFVDTDGAPSLYEALLPAAEQVGHTTVPKAVGHHYLGLLAAAMEDADRAEMHFAAAVGAHETMGLPLLLAESRTEWARVVLHRGGDANDVAAALGAVKATADAYSAPFLVRRFDELLGNHRAI